MAILAVKEMKQGGFILWETVIVFAALSILMTAALPKVHYMLAAAMTEYEARSLMADLRLAQSEALTVTEKITGISRDTANTNLYEPCREIWVYGTGYKIYSYKDTAIKLEHGCLSGVTLRLVSDRDTFEFRSNGTPSRGCTINVNYNLTDGKRLWRQVIIDPAGRIRLVRL